LAGDDWRKIGDDLEYGLASGPGFGISTFILIFITVHPRSSPAEFSLGYFWPHPWNLGLGNMHRFFCRG
jgi:hypothetical protein